MRAPSSRTVSRRGRWRSRVAEPVIAGVTVVAGAGVAETAGADDVAVWFVVVDAWWGVVVLGGGELPKGSEY